MLIASVAKKKSQKMRGGRVSRSVFEHIKFIREQINPFEKDVLNALDAVEKDLKKLYSEAQEFPIASFHEDDASTVCTRDQFRDRDSKEMAAIKKPDIEGE